MLSFERSLSNTVADDDDDDDDDEDDDDDDDDDDDNDDYDLSEFLLGLATSLARYPRWFLGLRLSPLMV